MAFAKKVVFATNNQHKLEEINRVIPKSIHILTLNDIAFTSEIPETGSTLEENALQKTWYIYQYCGKSCFSDDTGLEIAALNNNPGVYSARYAGAECDSEKNMNKVLMEMRGVHERMARFRTVIALIMEGKEHLFEGTVKGIIKEKPAGTGGFGYDPIFQPVGYEKTFAEMTLKEKNLISHRAMAIRQLIDFFNVKMQLH